MQAFLQCLSHTPLIGLVDPEQTILDEIQNTIAHARREIEAFDPELVLLFAPDHYNGFFTTSCHRFVLGRRLMQLVILVQQRKFIGPDRTYRSCSSSCVGARC